MIIRSTNVVLAYNNLIMETWFSTALSYWNENKYCYLLDNIKRAIYLCGVIKN